MAAVISKPDSSLFANTLYYKLCCFALFFAAAAASFNGFYDKNRLLDTDEFGNLHGRIAFEQFMDGTAYRPFIYRQMVPAIANFLNTHVSQQTQERLYARYVHGGVSIGRDPYDSLVLHDHRYFFRYITVYMMVFLFAWAAVYAMYVVARMIGSPPAAAALAAIAMILLVPYFEVNAGFYYDYPEILFFSLAVWTAYRFDWWWVVPIAVLGTWNKESFLLFTPSLYPLLRNRYSRRQALLATGVVVLACAAVYLPIHWHFRHNLGGTVEVHLGEQWHALFHPATLLDREWNYGLLAWQGDNILTVALVIWTLVRGWSWLPSAIRKHALIAAAINVPAFVIFCASGELRDLSMLYNTLLLLLAVNIHRIPVAGTVPSE